MRFNAGHAEVQAEGFAEQRGFSIAASGKAFKGLIDGLYSRKIEAITRELSTNAFDAHKAAGSIAPFEIHLPTRFAAVWHIRDFGTGMSHSLVMNRYTTLFDSTKDGLNKSDYLASTSEDAITAEANKQVGQLGLGSKSFFAYTDACTITTWVDGTMRVYSVFMGADGVPQIAYAGEMASDEPNGTKVEFPVNTKDIAEFEQAAIRVFKGFPVLPQGLPANVVEAIQQKPHQIGEFWKAFDSTYLPGAGFYARQGCVLYPIDLTQIDNKTSVDHEGKTILSRNYARFQNTSSTIVIDFPIGSVDFDLSRERLAYNEATITNIRTRWEEFAADLDGHFKRRFEGCKTPWQTMRQADSPLLSGFGVMFTASRYALDATALKKTLHDEGLPRDKKRRGIDGVFHSATRPSKDDARGYKVAYTREDYSAPSAESFSNAVLIYRDDKRKAGVNQRIAAYLTANGLRWAYTIDDGALTLRNFRKWGKPDIVRLSDIPALPKPERTADYAPPPPFARIKVTNKNGNLVAASDEDFTDGSWVYAIITRGTIVNPDENEYDHYNIQSVKQLSELLYATIGKRIAFINKRSNEPLSKFAGYELFYDTVDDWINHFTDQQVRWSVDLLNDERFNESRYQTPLDTWAGAMTKREYRRGDPLLNLRRFARRAKLVPKNDRMILRTVTITQEQVRNGLIERGRGLGLEILPKMAKNGWHGSENITNHRLLPPRWERLVEDLISVGHIHQPKVRTVYLNHLKEQFSC